MTTKHWLSLGVIVLAVTVLTLGSGYWVQARQHMGDENDHRMSEGQHGMMGNKNHQGMMGMPMMHSNMSEKQMDRLCDRMQQRHESMMEMRKKRSEKLNSLVESMKSAEEDEKIEAMEKTLVELIDQHNQHRTMRMGSMHGMMRFMMNMHQMDPDQRQMMMNRMQDCPMMSGDTGSSTE
jgi:hypothetical protein